MLPNYKTGGSMKNREGHYVGEFERECTKCGAIFLKTSKTVTICNKCNSERVKAQPEEKKMWTRAKGRAKAKDLPFDIEVSDIVFPEVCPVLGMKLVSHKGRPGAYRNSPSLDRVIPELGYVKGNVQVISQLANQMKLNASKEDLLSFAKWVNKNFGGD